MLRKFVLRFARQTRNYVDNARFLLTFGLVSFAACATPHQALATQSKPINVIYLMADDMGYADVTAFGGRFGHTPQLDRLASQGMMMTQFYSACAVCSPTRAAFLTGRYPLANEIDGHFPDKAGFFLRKQTGPEGGSGTLPGILRENGYRTLHVGKWHLGGVTLEELEHRKKGSGEFAESQGPHQHGFDDYYISQEDASTGVRAGLIRSATLYRKATQHLIHNEIYRHNPEEKRDWTKFKGDIATDFIAEMARGNRAFFLNVWFDVPHTPFEDEHVPSTFHFDTLSRQEVDHVGRAAHVLNPALTAERQKENHRRFLSMVTYMDHQVGRIVDAVHDPDGDGDQSDSIADHTLIIFTSDNGGAWPADNGPFSAGKASVFEGGVRVPTIVVLPGRIDAGSQTEQTGNTIDFMPSILKLTGLDDTYAGIGVDGIDLSPVWLGQSKKIDRGVMFSDLKQGYRPQRYGPSPEPLGYLSAQKGRFKVIFNHKDSVKPIAAFDLGQDPKEEVNLIKRPEYATEIQYLKKSAESWIGSIMEATDRKQLGE